MNTSIDYTGRLVDIELLKAIRVPEGSQSVHLLLTPQAMLTGIEKMIQRYVLLFLTPSGSVQFDSSFGTPFTQAVVNGTLINYGQLFATFAYANTLVIRTMLENIEGLPDDEIIDNVTLIDSNINFANSTLMLTLLFTTAAGTSAEFVIPTSIVKV